MCGDIFLIMVKLSDIAKRANVGVSTASYVLGKTGLHKVSPETRERILAAARELNYVPNVAGKALRKGMTYTAALLFPDISGSFAFNIIAGLENELNKNTYSMLFCKYRNQAEFEEKCRLLGGRQIDGVIVLGCYPGSEQAVCQLNKYHPVISLAHKIDVPEVPSVYVDGSRISFLAVKYLIGRGHRRIAIQQGVDSNKVAGAKAAADNSDVELLFAPREIRSGKDFLNWGLAQKAKITAFAAYSDQVAFEFIGSAIDKGIKIPDELSVVGVDGEEFGALLRPALTSIRQPDFEQGAAAVRLLMQKIKSGSAENMVLQPELLERSSVAKINK